MGSVLSGGRSLETFPISPAFPHKYLRKNNADVSSTKTHAPDVHQASTHPREGDLAPLAGRLALCVGGKEMALNVGAGGGGGGSQFKHRAQRCLLPTQTPEDSAGPTSLFAVF